MIINLNLHPKLGEGVYAHVFQMDDKAYKVFLAYPSPHSEEKRRSTFRSQCEAYRRAGSDPDLNKHIARFYGACVIEDLISEDGLSLKENRQAFRDLSGVDYMLDCCYVLEVLSGSHDKVLAVWNPSAEEHEYSYVGDAYSAFKRKAFNLADADVFNFDDAERFKFVDFS